MKQKVYAILATISFFMLYGTMGYIDHVIAENPKADLTQYNIQLLKFFLLFIVFTYLALKGKRTRHGGYRNRVHKNNTIYKFTRKRGECQCFQVKIGKESMNS